jgi:hypothetical protein
LHGSYRPLHLGLDSIFGPIILIPMMECFEIILQYFQYLVGWIYSYADGFICVLLA